MKSKIKFQLIKLLQNAQSAQRPQMYNTAQEPAATYLNTGSLFENKFELIDLIEEGISLDIFNLYRQSVPFTDEDWALFLDVSTKTLQRLKHEADYTFKAIHTEKILSLIEITLKGKSIFGSDKLFFEWLVTPNPTLLDRKPKELIRHAYGIEMVNAELSAIEHGIFA